MPLYYIKQEPYVGTTTALMEVWVSEERSARDADNSSSLLCAKKAVMLCFKARWLYALKPSDTEAVDFSIRNMPKPRTRVFHASETFWGEAKMWTSDCLQSAIDMLDTKSWFRTASSLYPKP